MDEEKMNIVSKFMIYVYAWNSSKKILIVLYNQELEFNLYKKLYFMVYTSKLWFLRNVIQKSTHSDVTSANTPITFETTDGFFASIHEANLTNYADMTLLKTENNPYSLNVI
jgi:alpha-glucosidase